MHVSHERTITYGGDFLEKNESASELMRAVLPRTQKNRVRGRRKDFLSFWWVTNFYSMSNTE